jgi:hypothetical protein
MLVGAFVTGWNDLVEEHQLDAAERAARLQGLDPFISDVITVTQARNISRIRNYGLNALYEGTAVAGRFAWGVNATLAEATIRAEDRDADVPTAPWLFGNARISYAFGGVLPTLALAAFYLSDRPADVARNSGFDPRPVAPAELQLRGALSGPLPILDGLSYRLIVDATTATRGAFAAGPVTIATPEQPSAELEPRDELRGYLGLSYDFAD